MLKTSFITAACAAAFMTAMSATPATAQSTLDSRTEFTFNQPVELPGATLPPGTYVFRFVDATSGRKVMQVQAKDASSKNYGLFMTISAQRARPSDDAELRFMETPAGQPAAVKTWWYPGQTIGREFIYPKEQARKLAQATNSSVLTTKADSVTNDQMQSADLTYVSPSGQETPLTDDQLVEAAATTAPVGATEANTAQNNAAQTTMARSNTGNTAGAPMPVGTAGAQSAQQGAQSAQQGTMARTRLPRTSTPLAGIALLGLFSLVSAAALRFRA